MSLYFLIGLTFRMFVAGASAAVGFALFNWLGSRIFDSGNSGFTPFKWSGGLCGLVFGWIAASVVIRLFVKVVRKLVRKDPSDPGLM